MALTYAEILANVSYALQDSGNAKYATADLDIKILEGLVEVSNTVPYEVKLTLPTVASSRDITLPSWALWKLISLDNKLEYPVGKDPKIFHNWNKFGAVYTMECYALPAVIESVYFFANRRHLLQKAVGTADLAGAVSTQGAVGDTSLVVKSLGTGTINEDTKLTIAGDTTVYNVTDTATIAANVATVNITPPLAAICLVDAVVTLALADSTLDPALERILTNLSAGRAAISKAAAAIGAARLATVTTFVGMTNQNSVIDSIYSQTKDWGQTMVQTARLELASRAPKKPYTPYPR